MGKKHRAVNIGAFGIALLICIATVNLAFADPTITTNSPLPDALLNTAYNTQVNAADGTVFNATVVDGEYGDWPAGSGYYWTISAGALPAGMNLQTTNPNGTGDFEWYDQGYNYYTARLPGQIKIVGSPTQTGVVTFTLTAHCFGGANVSKQFAITVGTNQLNITTASLPPNDINYAYSATVVATGGTTPYSWSITNGSLPAGLSLNSSTGVIAGTPTASGTSNFTVQVTSNDSQTATKALSIYIAPTISISTNSPLPGAYIYAPYSTVVNAADGTLVQATVVDGEYGNWSAGSGYRWELAAGNLPPSMALVTNNASGSAEDWYDQGNNHFSGWLPGQGLLVGSPSATGTYNFTLRAIGYLNRSITKEFSITVTVTPLSITTNSLPQADPNIAYSTTLHFAGGITPVTWSIINGSLPSGISLDSQTGVIAGTSTEAGTTAYFTVQASSHDGQVISKSLSLHIAPALTVHTESLPQPVYNTPYSTVISVTGGTVISATVVDGEYGDWFAGTGYLMAVDGTMPPGLGLTSTHGDPCEWYSQSNQHYFSPIAGLPKITGTPTHGGTYTFIISVTDYLGATSSRQYTMILEGPSNIPLAPSNFAVTAVSSTQIYLQWSDNSNYEQGFKIERKLEWDGAFEQIAIVNANITVYTDTGLTEQLICSYRVRTYNDYGNSDYSNEDAEVTPAYLYNCTELLGVVNTHNNNGNIWSPAVYNLLVTDVNSAQLSFDNWDFMSAYNYLNTFHDDVMVNRGQNIAISAADELLIYNDKLLAQLRPTLIDWKYKYSKLSQLGNGDFILERKGDVMTGTFPATNGQLLLNQPTKKHVQGHGDFYIFQEEMPGVPVSSTAGSTTVSYYGNLMIIDVTPALTDTCRGDYDFIQLVTQTNIYTYTDNTIVTVVQNCKVDVPANQQFTNPYYAVVTRRAKENGGETWLLDMPGIDNPWQKVLGRVPADGKPVVTVGTKVKWVFEFKTWVINKQPFKVIGYFESGFTLEFTVGNSAATTVNVQVTQKTPQWVDDNRVLLDNQLAAEGYPALPQ